MDQIKIGKFIAERRKSKNLTQMQLAEKLNITDRAVSKWETGKAMPDASIMLELCDILDISVNDLLSGEVVTMENYNKQLENNLLEVIKQKEQSDKRLLRFEVFITIISILILLIFAVIVKFLEMPTWLQFTLIGIGLAICVSGCLLALRIEQLTGYYECKNCKHKYVPTYRAVLVAPHLNRTRYMKCPKCGETTWQEKVLKKE